MRVFLRLGVVYALLATSSHAASVAVLPLANATPGSVPDADSLDWVGESITWTLREAFASRGLIALNRGVVRESFRTLHLKPYVTLSKGSAIKLAQAVDAEHLVYGSFVFTPAAAGSTDSVGSIKVVTRILDLRKLRESPEASEEGKLEDLARISTRLAWHGLAFLAPGVAPLEAEAGALQRPVRLDAQEMYIRGLMAAGEEQEKYFRQAAMLDPGFSHPAFELGKLLFDRKQYREAATWLDKAQPSDVHFREAMFLAGRSRFEIADFAGAEKAFRTTAEAVPLSEAWNNLAAAESRRNLPQAIDNFRKALDGDPNDPDYHFNLGYALLKRGEYAAAADRFRAVLDRTPNDNMATLLLGRSLKKQPLRLDPRGPDARYLAVERLKTNFDEQAYLQLKSVLESKEE